MATTAANPIQSKPSLSGYHAAVVHEFDAPLSIEEVPRRALEPGQILVKVEASGLCHTDIHAAHGDWPVKPSPPFIPGHEGVGIVVELGPGVTEVTLGDRVAMPWLGYACGTCDYCVSGWETLCESQRNMGYSIDGAFGEFAIAYARYTVKVPEDIDPFDAAPLTCAGVTTYKAIKVAGTRSSDLVAVFGVGGLGHLAIQYAAIAGGRVIAAYCSMRSWSSRSSWAPSSPSTPPGRTPSRQSRRSEALIRRSRWRCRHERSSRPTERCVAAGNSCASRCPPTTTSRSRSSRPC
jgi:D-arabinose 1-dehydrogenase-like Zn-dependent alcohol dehydrogenase